MRTFFIYYNVVMKQGLVSETLAAHDCLWSVMSAGDVMTEAGKVTRWACACDYSGRQGQAVTITSKL